MSSKQPTLKERIAAIETHVTYIREGIDEIREALAGHNGVLLNHDRRITRLSTMQKLLFGMFFGGGGLSGIVYAVLHLLGR